MCLSMASITPFLLASFLFQNSVNRSEHLESHIKLIPQLESLPASITLKEIFQMEKVISTLGGFRVCVVHRRPVESIKEKCVKGMESGGSNPGSASL